MGPTAVLLRVQGIDELDGIGGEGAPGSSNNSSGRRTPSTGAGSGAAGRKSGGVPLSSITKGFYAGERRERAVSAVGFGRQNLNITKVGIM